MGGRRPQGVFGSIPVRARHSGTAPPGSTFRADVLLPITHREYDGERVVRLSFQYRWREIRARAYSPVGEGQEKSTRRAEMDFADWWDKWPGPARPLHGALETITRPACLGARRSTRWPRAWSSALTCSPSIILRNLDICGFRRMPITATRRETRPWRNGVYRAVHGTVLASGHRFFYNGRVMERCRRFPYL